MKPNQCHAAVLLAAGQSQIDVATQLNVHPETIRNWTKKPDFQAMLADETRITLEKLRNSSSQALLSEMEHIKKREQNHARTSTHDEKARTGDVARAETALPVPHVLTVPHQKTTK